MSRHYLAVALLALLAFAAGCGGGGDSISTSATSATEGGSTSTSTSATSAPSTAKAEKDNTPSKGNAAKPTAPNGGSEGSKATEAATPSGSAPTDPSPLPNEGTDEVAPEVPTTAGGDNSIQEYGVEADSAERIEVAQIIGAYLSAQASGDWQTACSHLWSPVRERLESLAERVGEGQGCAGAMAAALSKMPQAELQRRAEIEVLSVRAQGDRAFVIYRDGAGEPFNLPLIQKGGEWALTTLIGIGLVL